MYVLVFCPQEKDEAEYLLWLKGQKQNLDPGDQVGIELVSIMNCILKYLCDILMAFSQKLVKWH